MEGTAPTGHDSEDSAAATGDVRFRLDVRMPEDPSRALDCALGAWGALPPYRVSPDAIRLAFCDVAFRLFLPDWTALPETVRDAVEFAVHSPTACQQTRFRLAWALAERPGSSD